MRIYRIGYVPGCVDGCYGSVAGSSSDKARRAEMVFRLIRFTTDVDCTTVMHVRRIVTVLASCCTQLETIVAITTFYACCKNSPPLSACYFLLPAEATAILFSASSLSLFLFLCEHDNS